jgi:ribA/ribD-fused uncharacterized protein
MNMCSMDVKTVITDTHVYFYTDVCSNWWATVNQLKDPTSGLVFNNTEAAFMWHKAKFFGDTETAAKIAAHAAANGHPHLVKQLGREIKPYDDASWDTVRQGFMAYVNLLKFRQNPKWGEQLKATGNRILVEASPVDRIWGIGRTVQEAAAGAEWNGRNLLGEALMTVRGML